MADEEEYITATEARERLGISKGKLARMIERGDLAVEIDPLDRRMKMVRRADVEALLSKRRAPAAGAARRQTAGAAAGTREASAAWSIG